MYDILKQIVYFHNLSVHHVHLFLCMVCVRVWIVDFCCYPHSIVRLLVHRFTIRITFGSSTQLMSFAQKTLHEI